MWAGRPGGLGKRSVALINAARRFDEQAGSFERRAGLPESLPQTIAQAVARLTAIAPRELLLEVGAGTGQIGEALAGLPLRYIGFDASLAMLGIFRRRAGGRTPPLVNADGDYHWPVRDGTVQAVFSSRAIHLLRTGHVVDELFRVASPMGAALILGRVRRDKRSLRSQLRREMRERLRRLGYASSEGQRKEREVLEACVRRGAAPIEEHVVAAWPVEDGVTRVLTSWREKPGLAGIELPDKVKEEILSGLPAWAEEALGSPDASESAQEEYVLEGVRAPGGHGV